MKILCPISSAHDPASRFRLLQYEKLMGQLGNEITYKIPQPLKESDPPARLFRNRAIWNMLQLRGRKKLFRQQYNYDLAWQNRMLLSERFVEKHYRIPFVMDIDDSIWLTEGRKEVKEAINKATLVFAGNEFIAGFAGSFNHNIKVIPTTVDCEYYQPNRNNNKRFTVGWIGTKSNFRYLLLAKQAIDDFLAKKDACLHIISSEPPDAFSFDGEKYRFTNWSAEKETAHINGFDIGIMPLADDEWTRGKCGMKLLQYMACGIPFVASPVGVNSKFIEESEAGIATSSVITWIEALNFLSSDASSREKLGANGRRYVESNYSIDKWAPIINEEFKRIT
jgi:glycosyltransferase involved in cell wall biosynthesis